MSSLLSKGLNKKTINHKNKKLEKLDVVGRFQPKYQSGKMINVFLPTSIIKELEEYANAPSQRAALIAFCKVGIDAIRKNEINKKVNISEL